MNENDETTSSVQKALERLPDRRRLRRRLRRIESKSLKHAQTFLVERWQNAREARRHIVLWLGLVTVLIGSLFAQAVITQKKYITPVPQEGGTYKEGVLGDLETLNPIFASSGAEKSAARLMFSGLLQYDATGNLIGDLAESWTVGDGGKVYDFVLRPQLRWQDGAPLTADDVVFTVNTIQNPDVRSPFYGSWRSIAVEAVDKRTVRFRLPSAAGPFPHLLTVGIIPKHKLEDIAPGNIRTSDFSLSPTTNGPFVFRSLQRVNTTEGRYVVHMAANNLYQHGQPKLERFQLFVYPDKESLAAAFMSGEVNAVADLTTQDIGDLGEQREYKVAHTPVDNVMMAIFKTDDGVMQDVKVRKAFELATDRRAIINKLGGKANLLETPIPTGGIVDVSGLAQSPFSLDAAKQHLEAAGWAAGNNGARTKDGQPLKVSLVGVRSGDYPLILETLAEQWSKLGAQVTTRLEEPDRVQQDVLAPRLYDVVLYELAVGGDPDVYAYWHSSQAGMNGINLANYRSGAVDDALSSARSRIEPELRSAKYRTFIQQWLNDVPAVALYQPHLHYVTGLKVEAIDESHGSLVDYVDRYRSVLYWSADSSATYDTP